MSPSLKFSDKIYLIPAIKSSKLFIWTEAWFWIFVCFINYWTSLIFSYMLSSSTRLESSVFSNVWSYLWNCFYVSWSCWRSTRSSLCYWSRETRVKETLFESKVILISSSLEIRFLPGSSIDNEFSTWFPKRFLFDSIYDLLARICAYNSSMAFTSQTISNFELIYLNCS